MYSGNSSVLTSLTNLEESFLDFVSVQVDQELLNTGLIDSDWWQLGVGAGAEVRY